MFASIPENVVDELRKVYIMNGANFLFSNTRFVPYDNTFPNIMKMWYITDESDILTPSTAHHMEIYNIAKIVEWEYDRMGTKMQFTNEFIDFLGEKYE